MNAVRIPNGLELDFIPSTGGASDAFLAIDSNGAVVKYDSIAVNRLVAQTASRVAVFDGSGFLSSSSITPTKLGYLTDVTSNIQAQLNAKEGAVILTANRLVVSGAGGLLEVSATSKTQAGYLSGLTSDVQTQINVKQNTIIGAASTAVTSDFTPLVAVFTNGSGKLVTENAFTKTIASYLETLSSDAQVQIDSKLTVVLTSPTSGQTISFNGTNWINSASTALPAGGTTNQILRKASNADFDTAWHTLVLADLTDVSSTAAELNILSGAIITVTELNFLDGVTSNLQTELNSKVDNNLSYNAIWVGDAGNHAVQLVTGSDGKVLTSIGGVPTWQTPSPPGDVSGPGASTDNAIVRFNGALGDSIQNSGVIISDTDGISGIASLTLVTGGALRTNTSAGNTLLLQAYDVDGVAYTTFATLTANNTPTFDLATSVTIGTAYVYRVAGTDVALADGGTGVTLADPGANRLWGWDDTDNAIAFITIGTNLSYDHASHTLSATGGGGSGDVVGPGSATDKAIARFNTGTGKLIQNSVVIVDDTGNFTGIGNFTHATGSAIRTSTSAGNTLLFQAYDVDGATYTTFATLTANNTPTFDLNTAVTIGAAYVYRIGGTDVSLADGGTGASLVDPGADRILFWDDSATSTAFLVPGNTLSISTVTIDVVLGGATDELQKNDGGEFAGTGVFSTTDGDLLLGTALGGTTRILTADGSGADINLSLVGKGTGYVKTSGSLGVGVIPTGRLHVVGSGATTGKLLYLQNVTPSDILTVLDDGNYTHNQITQAITNTFQTFTQAAHTGGSPIGLLFTAGAHTTLAAAEAIDFHINLARTVQITLAGAIATQRAFYISAPTYSATAATQTITSAGTLVIANAPTAGTNVSITNRYSIWSQSGPVFFDDATASTTKAGLTIRQSGSSGKLMVDVQKSSSIFKIYQEGITDWIGSAAGVQNTAFHDISGTITSTFSAPGDYSAISWTHPTFTVSTGGVTEFMGWMRFTGTFAFGANVGNLIGIDYNPTVTGTPTSQQGILIRPAIANGFGLINTLPTALLHFGAGTATLAPLKFTSGTNLTSAIAGTMEYDGTNLYFTPTGTTRKTISYLSNTGAADELVKSDGTNLVPSGIFSTALGNIVGVNGGGDSVGIVLSATGNIITSNRDLLLFASDNISFLKAMPAPSFGSGVKIAFWADSGTNPSGNPTAGFFWYSDNAKASRATIKLPNSVVIGIGGEIFDGYADAGNVTTTETDLFSYNTPASTFSINGTKIQSEYGGVFVSSATATRKLKIYFGGTAIFDSGALTLSLSSSWTIYVTLIRVSSTIVRYMISMTTEGAALSAYTSVGELTGLTLSNTNILKITGTAAGVGAASGDITLKLARGSWLPVSNN